MAALIAYVKTAFSNSPDVLADFGLTPKKVKAPLTIAQQAAAAAKRAATLRSAAHDGNEAKEASEGHGHHDRCLERRFEGFAARRDGSRRDGLR
jgi:hypothetical protein